MAVEFPSALIRKLQATTRKEAGLSHYDPGDPALRRLPTLREAISGLDPGTPPYLRCRHCHGKLLRGLQTMVCVYCGAVQRKDGLPFTISFNSTEGCKKMLEALDLDGSEPVTLHADSSDSGKSEGMMKAGLFLSDLLDLELVWPPEENEKFVPTQNLSPLSVSGVDLDNFFSGKKGLEDSDTLSMPHHVSEMEHVVSQDSNLSSDFGSFEAFESIQSKDIIEGSAETKASDLGGSFADWDADFQSAGSDNPLAGSKTVDMLQGPFSNTLNSLTDRESGLNNASNEQMVNQLEQHTKNVVISDATIQMKTNANSTTDVFENKSNNYLVVSEPPERTKLPSDVMKNDDEDSFDTWQDFTSSQGVLEVSSDSWAQIGEKRMVSNERSHELNSQSKNDVIDDMGFGIFSQSVPPEVRNDLTNKNLIDTSECVEFGVFQSSSPVLIEVRNGTTNKEKLHSNLTDKMSSTENVEGLEFGSILESNPSRIKDAKNNPVDKNIGSNAPHTDRENVLDDFMSMGGTREKFSSTVKMEPVSTHVDDLLSQMNDLSFMLEGNLSIPQNTKSSDSVP